MFFVGKPDSGKTHRVGEGNKRNQVKRLPFHKKEELGDDIQYE